MTSSSFRADCFVSITELRVLRASTVCTDPTLKKKEPGSRPTTGGIIDLATSGGVIKTIFSSIQDSPYINRYLFNCLSFLHGPAGGNSSDSTRQGMEPLASFYHWANVLTLRRRCFLPPRPDPSQVRH